MPLIIQVPKIGPNGRSNEFDVSAQPVDAQGQPAKLQGPITAAPDKSDGITVVPTGDLSFTVRTLGSAAVPGTTTITVTGTTLKGSVLTDTVSVEVQDVQAEAVSLGLVASAIRESA